MARNLRVAYILPGFCADEDDPCIPVITTFIREMARHLEPVIYTAGYPHRPGSYSVHGIPIHCTGGIPRNRLDKIKGWRRLGRQLEEDHSRQPFDIVHGFWATAPGYSAAHGGKKIRRPSIVSLAGGEFARFREENYGSQLHPWSRWIVNASLNSATHVTAGSTWLAEKIPSRYREKLSVIPLGLETESFAPGERRTGRKLLAVAAMIPIKDYSTLLRGVAHAHGSIPDITLSIVGWKENRIELERVERLIVELKLEEVVNILGEVHHSAIPELYRSHDLFLHSSRYEAQGMAILEALATGMPVISSDVGIAGSLPENMLYRFQPGDSKRMGELILHSLSDTRHSEAAHHGAPALIRSEFDVRKVAERFTALYRSF